MTRIPKNLGWIHFVGIGGIGMCGLAQMLFEQGFKVRGSDIAKGGNVETLKGIGIEVAIGHTERDVKGAKVLVRSSAIGDDNPEILAAQAQGIPVIGRADMLAELMRLRSCIGVAGSHGKSTTTSLIAALLGGGGIDPTVVNGGVINAYGSSYRLGQGEWMVVETDESDGSFLRLPILHAVVTNIDSEHLDHFGSFEAVRAAFLSFMQNIPFYGCCFLCRDDESIQSLIGKVEGRRIITYGLSPQATVSARSLGVTAEGQEFEVLFRTQGEAEKSKQEVLKVRLPIFGKHNLVNSLAALAVGDSLGVGRATMVKTLASFSGVMRRFQVIAKVRGATVIDDYAHHPREVEAVLEAARQTGAKRVTAIFQPHRYSRVASLFDGFCRCFDQADRVLVSKIYAANEAPIEGIDHKVLAESIGKAGHRMVEAFDGYGELLNLLGPELEEGGMIIFMGAGSITRWANDFVKEIKGAGGSGENAGDRVA